jgi:hypothetical protein
MIRKPLDHTQRPAIEASNLLDCDGKNVLPYYTTHALHAPHGGKGRYVAAKAF